MVDRLIRRARIAEADWPYIDTGGDGRPLIMLPGSVGTCENVLQANCLLLALAFILCKSII
jgi:hypothetical protein